jgi:hypothetical protein
MHGLRGNATRVPARFTADDPWWKTVPLEEISRVELLAA